ncbi:MAG: 3-phosphoshikimate 1-carboxyvinyltransferase [Chitinophagaceae bacterium]
MKVTVQPGFLQGTVIAPASKSSMQRACAAALIRKGTSVINNPGISNDDQAALSVITQLGAKPQFQNNQLIIESKGVNPVANLLNCGESGLGIRMFAPIVALHNQAMTIEGKGSLLTRPMNFFDEVLPLLNVQIQSNNGKLPLQLTGPLTAADITIDGSLSSQFLTGLLMAYSAIYANSNQVLPTATITVNNLKSKPYIDLTLTVMEAFGLPVPVNNEYKTFEFSQQNNPNLSNKSVEYTVEGDWSGAAFLLVAGAVAGNITVKGLDVFSTQADKAILQALMDAGSQISIQPHQIDIQKTALKAFHFNATDCPDLFPPLVALAANCNGKSVIEGVNRLAHKESNRALTLQEEFKKLGIEIVLQDDLMIIDGGKIAAAETYSHHDHRITMACAVAALNANGPVVLSTAEAINKSYPNFFEHIKQIGAKYAIED